MLDTNPASGPGYDLLNLGTVTEEAFSFLTGMKASFTSRAAVKDASLAYFDDGISGDGAHTYETLHIGPAWGGLKTGRVISIEGQIEKGDLDKLKTLVETSGFSDCLRPGYCPYNNVIMLDSPGGQLMEALAIGKYIAGQNFHTLLPENAVCESACSMIFLAGYTRYEGYFFPRRFAHETARLGIHQPFFQLPEGTYDAGQVDRVVRALNSAVTEVTAYFLNSGIGIGFLQSMYRTAPESMYYPSLAEMASEHIFVVGTNTPLLDMTRPQMLSYCANIYRGRYNEVAPDLLANLQSNERTFLTYVVGRNFVCLGVRSDGTGEWKSYVCSGESKCLLEEFAQNDIYELQKRGRLKRFRPSDVAVMERIAVGLDNTEVGLALKDFTHRVAMLHYMQLFAEKFRDYAAMFKSIPASLALSGVPGEFCGQVDEYDAGLVRKVQASMNAKGITSGKPDGSLGPNTRKAIRRTGKDLLGRDVAGIEPDLLLALGLPEEEFRQYVLCR